MPDSVCMTNSKATPKLACGCPAPKGFPQVDLAFATCSPCTDKAEDKLLAKLFPVKS